MKTLVLTLIAMLFPMLAQATPGDSKCETEIDGKTLEVWVYREVDEKLNRLVVVYAGKEIANVGNLKVRGSALVGQSRDAYVKFDAIWDDELATVTAIVPAAGVLIGEQTMSCTL